MTASPAPYSSGSSSRASALSPGKSLRATLEARRVLTFGEAVAVVVPLCLDLKSRHERGERLYVHPSCVVSGSDGLARVDPALARPSSNPHDRACLAPELQASGQPGDARASVFAVGAILYEAVTGHAVGPGMQRPRAVVPTLPEAFETLLAKALVSNPHSRPDDLGALASALHGLAPSESIRPPAADVSRLDQSDGFEVDIRLSMLPLDEISPQGAAPSPAIPPSPAAPRLNAASLDPFGAVVDHSQPAARARNDPTMQLAELKARLESDPRPRYVVNKDRMDHGPFSAVELLQQITSNQFVSKDILRDELSGQERAIGEWEEFAAFASQAALKREVVAEKKAVIEVEKSEKRSGIAKTVIGLIVICTLASAAAVWFFKVRGSRKDDVDLADDPNAIDYDLQGGVKGQHRAGAAGHGGGHGGGGFAGGMSYEAALASNVQEVNIGGGAGGPDLTDGQLAGPMKSAGFITGCGAPDSMKVTVKVAIKGGRAVGVSVYTNPPDPKVSSCVDGAVRRLSWPANGKMDSFTTTY